MKKIIAIISLFLISNNIFAQDYLGAKCTCTSPATSTCDANCSFSDCCICWDPNKETGACACYWGVASCRSGAISKGVESSGNEFTSSPNAKIRFSFEKFVLVFDFFKTININTDNLQSVFNKIKLKYQLTGGKILIDNTDYDLIINEYSKIIKQLTNEQKEKLNNFIFSIK